MSTRTLRVYPNPWSAPLDKHGTPCGICPRDPDSDGGGPGQYVGARVDRKRTEVLQKLEPNERTRSARQNTFYEYLGVASNDPELAQKLSAAAPVEVPRTAYYRARIADGSLICADKATAESTKFPYFVEPAKFFAQFVKEAPVVEKATETAPETTAPAASTPALLAAPTASDEPTASSKASDEKAADTAATEEAAPEAPAPAPSAKKSGRSN